MYISIFSNTHQIVRFEDYRTSTSILTHLYIYSRKILHCGTPHSNCHYIKYLDLGVGQISNSLKDTTNVFAEGIPKTVDTDWHQLMLNVRRNF